MDDDGALDDADALDAVADRLYALPPEDFTAARDAAAKQAAGKEQRNAVKALRRPSVSAWVVNLLAREQAELLQQLLDLGPALAEAQRGGQGDALRTLGAQRRELVGAVTATAAGLAARAVSAQVRIEVEQTLEAALADPRAADAVRSGRLVRPLSYAGFGDVDLDDAVAVQPVPRTTAVLERAPDVTALERVSLDAAAALDDAVSACEQAERRRAQAQQDRDAAHDAAGRAHQEVQRLEERLAKARGADDQARQAAAAADDAAGQADADAERGRRAVADAQAAAERARAELDRARRDGGAASS